MRIRQSQRNTFTLRPLILCLYVFHFNVVMMSSQPTLTPRRRRRWCLSWRFSFTLETTLTSLTCWEPAPSEVRGVTTSTFSSLRIRFACEIFVDWYLSYWAHLSGQHKPYASAVLFYCWLLWFMIMNIVWETHLPYPHVVTHRCTRPLSVTEQPASAFDVKTWFILPCNKSAVCVQYYLAV